MLFFDPRNVPSGISRVAHTAHIKERKRLFGLSVKENPAITGIMQSVQVKGWFSFSFSEILILTILRKQKSIHQFQETWSILGYLPSELPAAYICMRCEDDFKMIQQRLRARLADAEQNANYAEAVNNAKYHPVYKRFESLSYSLHIKWQKYFGGN